MTIDDRLAFGEYVSLPIRTEKTAEQKWVELRKEVEVRINDLTENLSRATMLGDSLWETIIQHKRQEMITVLHYMEYLDTASGNMRAGYGERCTDGERYVHGCQGR